MATFILELQLVCDTIKGEMAALNLFELYLAFDAIMVHSQALTNITCSARRLSVAINQLHATWFELHALLEV